MSVPLCVPHILAARWCPVAGTVVLSTGAAEALGSAAGLARTLVPGDVVLLRLDATALVRNALAPAVIAAGLPPTQDAGAWPQLADDLAAHTAVALTVHTVIPTTRGKASMLDASLLWTELRPLLPTLAAALHPALRGQLLLRPQQRSNASTATAGGMAPSTTVSVTLSASPGGGGSLPGAPLVVASGTGVAFNVSRAGGSSAFAVVAPPGLSDGSILRAFASRILVNLPPSQRVQAYQQSDYARVRSAVADFASNALFIAGFTETVRGAALTPRGRWSVE